MAYYKVLLEVWCDWDPEKSDLKEIVGHVALGEGAICTLREVVKIVDHPQDIDNEAAMSFFGGEEGDADQSLRIGQPYRGGRRFARRWRPDKRMSLRKA